MAHVVEVVKAGVEPGRVASIHFICSKCSLKIPRHSVYCMWCGVKFRA